MSSERCSPAETCAGELQKILSRYSTGARSSPVGSAAGPAGLRLDPTADTMREVARIVGCRPVDVYGSRHFIRSSTASPRGTARAGSLSHSLCALLGGRKLTQHR